MGRKPLKFNRPIEVCEVLAILVCRVADDNELNLSAVNADVLLKYIAWLEGMVQGTVDVVNERLDKEDRDSSYDDGSFKR